MLPQGNQVSSAGAAHGAVLRQWLRQALLVEFAGACLLLVASGYSEIGWVRALGQPTPFPVRALAGAAPLALLVAGLVLMFVGYALALRVIGRVGERARPGLRAILLVALALALPLLLLISIPSRDIYSYAMYGRIEAVYDADPYSTRPDTFLRDPFLHLVSDRGAVSVYGPAWQVVSRTLVTIAGPDMSARTAALGYKTLSLSSLLACAALIWAILGRLVPSERSRGTWLFATNPLCLLELAGAGHNDGLMMVLVLLAVLAQLRGRTLLAVVSLGAAVLVKWIALLLVPAYLLWLVRGGFLLRVARDVLAGGAVVLLLALALYGRHWNGRQTFESISGNVASTRFNNSLAAWAADQIHPAPLDRAPLPPLRERATLEGEAGLLRERPVTTPMLSPAQTRLKWGFSLLFAAWALVLLRRASGMRELMEVWGWTLFAYVCLAAVWFWPWYVVWVLPFAALSPRSGLARATLLLSATACLVTLRWAAWVAAGYDAAYAPLLVFLPPLGLAAAYLARLRPAARLRTLAPATGSRK